MPVKKTRPKVILHNAVSLDSKIDGFTPDIGLFYELASTWKEDATLAGADTLLAAILESDNIDNTEPAAPPPARRGDKRPLLVVTDSRGRIRCWQKLREAGYWRGLVALCSKSTPKTYIKYLEKRYVDCIIAGKDKADLKAALAELKTRYRIKIIRADSGGTLNAALLRAGLVDEISLLVHPTLAQGQKPRPLFREMGADSPMPDLKMKLLNSEIQKDSIVWLRYGVFN